MAAAHAAGTCSDACSRLHPGQLIQCDCIVPAAVSQHCDWASFPLSFSFILFFFFFFFTVLHVPLSSSFLSIIIIIITTDIDCPNTAGFHPLSQHHWLSAYLTATRISLPPTAHALARHTAVYHSREKSYTMKSLIFLASSALAFAAPQKGLAYEQRSDELCVFLSNGYLGDTRNGIHQERLCFSADNSIKCNSTLDCFYLPFSRPTAADMHTHSSTPAQPVAQQCQLDPCPCQ